MKSRKRPVRRRLAFEVLEGRRLLSADVALTNLRLVPVFVQPLETGQYVAFMVDATNIGDSPASAAAGQLNVTRDGDSASSYSTDFQVPSLRAGERQTVRVPGPLQTMWHVTTNGLFTAIASIGQEGPTGDRRNDNNRAALPVQVGVPDLEIASQPRIVSPSVPSPSRQALGDLTLLGQPTQIQVEVRNNGDGPYQSHVEVQVTYWEATGVATAEWVGVVTFDVGNGETLQGIAKNPKNPADPFWTPQHAGIYTISATVDPPYTDHPQGDALESREDNNTAARGVHVHAQLPAATGQPSDWLRGMLTPDQDPSGGGGSLVNSYFPTDHVPPPTLATLGDKPLYDPAHPEADLESLEWNASSYDNALAVIALSSTGKAADIAQAALILTELQSLQAADGSFPSIWYAPLPHELVINPARTVGNNAWVVLAVCRYTEQTGDTRFLTLAEHTADWLLQWQDPTTGLLTAGLGADGQALTWIATEHNEDAVSALESLARLDPADKDRYLAAAGRVRQGIAQFLWIETEGRFRRGLNDNYPVSDVQSWGVLSLGPTGPHGEDYRRALDWAVTNCTFVDDLYGEPLTGIDFNDHTTDTISPEQTESLALAWLSAGDANRYEFYHSQMTRLADANGGVRYSSRPGDIDETGEKTVTLEAVAGTAWWQFSDGHSDPFHPTDNTAPTSHVADLPLTESTGSFAVTWTGQDDAGGTAVGSGIAAYDVYVADAPGPFSAWLTATPKTSESYVGQVGHTYQFYSVATDHVGHREAAPATPDTQTTILVNPWHNYANPCDVDGNTRVEALDVLFVITYVNNHPGDPALPAPSALPGPYYDVTGPSAVDDGRVTPLDVLTVIAWVDSHPPGASEGEAAPLAAVAGTGLRLAASDWGRDLSLAHPDRLTNSHAAPAPAQDRVVPWPATYQSPRPISLATRTVPGAPSSTARTSRGAGELVVGRARPTREPADHLFGTRAPEEEAP